MTARAQAASLFDTPVIVDRPQEAAGWNRALRANILERRGRDAGVSVSNLGGWHSATDLLTWGGSAAHELTERVIATASGFTTDVRARPDGSPRFRWHPEAWANVSPPGAANQFHNHPGAYWSAVYYVDDGYGGSTDETLGGELVLLDPRMPAIAMNSPDLRFQRPGQRPEERERWMRPESGRLVIFPAWLSHAVRPYAGADLRVSVAINLSAVPVGT